MMAPRRKLHSAAWSCIKPLTASRLPASIFEVEDDFGRTAWIAVLPVAVPPHVADLLDVEIPMGVVGAPRVATSQRSVALKSSCVSTLLRHEGTHETMLIVRGREPEELCALVGTIDAGAAVGLWGQVEGVEMEEMDLVSVKLVDRRKAAVAAIFGGV